LNDQRKQLAELPRQPRCLRIVVEHRQRLAHFGIQAFEHALAACGRDIRLVDEKEIDDDRVGDVIDVMTSMAARRYGQRSAPQRAEQAVKAIAGET
jgi:putative resolvase